VAVPKNTIAMPKRKKLVPKPPKFKMPKKVPKRVATARRRVKTNSFQQGLMCKVDLATNLKNKQVEAVIEGSVSGSKQTRSTIHDTPLSRVWLVANAFLGYLGGSRGWEGGVSGSV
jgi:hypothetical protein